MPTTADTSHVPSIRDDIIDETPDDELVLINSFLNSKQTISSLPGPYRNAIDVPKAFKVFVTQTVMNVMISLQSAIYVNAYLYVCACMLCSFDSTVNYKKKTFICSQHLHLKDMLLLHVVAFLRGGQVVDTFSMGIPALRTHIHNHTTVNHKHKHIQAHMETSEVVAQQLLAVPHRLTDTSN